MSGIRHRLTALAIVCGVSACNPFANRPALEFSTAEQAASHAQMLDTSLPATSATLREATSFTRTSGQATALRLKAIFSDSASVAAIDSVLFDTAETSAGTASERTAADLFMGRERVTGVTAMSVFLELIAGRCKDAPDSVFAEGATTALESVWLAGETSPSISRWYDLSLIAARRAWLYPVSTRASDPNIAAIAAMAATLESEGKSETLIKTAICRVVFESPQFWLGVPGDKFWVTRSALEIGLRLPKNSEYEDALADRLTPAQLVERLQSEDNYLRAVRRWHQDWLAFGDPGLTRYVGDSSQKVHFPPIAHGNYAKGVNTLVNLAMKITTKGYGSTSSTTTPITIYNPDGSVADANAKVMISALPYQQHVFSESFGISGTGDRLGPLENCVPIAQPFDPSTGKVSVEFYDPTARTWKEMAAQTYDSSYVGDYTVSEGAYPVAMSELANTGVWRASSTEASAAASAFPSVTYYQGGREQSFSREFRPAATSGVSRIKYLSPVAGTATAKAVSIHPYGWRVRRFARPTSGTSGFGDEQYGMSQVYLPWSREKVWVCNAYTRMVSTCGYYPQDGTRVTVPYVPSGGTFSSTYSMKNVLKSDPRANTAAAPWSTVSLRVNEILLESAGLARTFMGFNYNDNTHVRDDGWLPLVDRNFGHGGAVANMQVLNDFYCGIPDADALSDGTTLEDLSTDVLSKSAPYQEVAYNASVDPYWDSSTDEDSSSDERNLLRTIGEDLAEEPYRLIEHLVHDGADYRELLTANYTYGRKPLYYYYLTQGYPLPEVLPNAKHKPGDAGFDDGTVVSFSKSDFPKYSRRWIQTYNRDLSGTNGVEANFYNDPPGAFGAANYEDYGHLQEVSPRPMAGILSQPAFIEAAAPKVRSLVSRIFMRLMCSNPAAISLTDDQKAAQDAYVYTAAHLRPDCLSCHRHVDPAARAISHLFGLSKVGGHWQDDEIETLGSANSMSSQAGIFGIGLATTVPGTFWGLRGTSEVEPFTVNGRLRGQGMFLGQEVTGLEQLASIAANSREFAQCVTIQTLRGLYGRFETLEDMTMINEAVEQFMDPAGLNYNYNALVKFLATQPHFYSVQ